MQHTNISKNKLIWNVCAVSFTVPLPNVYVEGLNPST